MLGLIIPADLDRAAHAPSNLLRDGRSRSPLRRFIMSKRKSTRKPAPRRQKPKPCNHKIQTVTIRQFGRVTVYQLFAGKPRKGFRCGKARDPEIVCADNYPLLRYRIPGYHPVEGKNYTRQQKDLALLGFRPDWGVDPWLLIEKGKEWKSWEYPYPLTPESVKQWLQLQKDVGPCLATTPESCTQIEKAKDRVRIENDHAILLQALGLLASQAVIVRRGKRLYSFAGGADQLVTLIEDYVLAAFFGHSLLSSRELMISSHVVYAPKVMRGIYANYPGADKCIRLPGQSKRGYYACVTGIPPPKKPVTGEPVTGEPVTGKPVS
jgi:hypothetical protein